VETAYEKTEWFRLRFSSRPTGALRRSDNSAFDIGLNVRCLAMKRYTGKTSIKHVERAFPHIVETAIPDAGLGTRLDIMFQWHRARGLDVMNGRGRRDENGRNYIRWCFADADAVVVFADEFDGTIGH
jgi:hypothetical protein